MQTMNMTGGATVRRTASGWPLTAGVPLVLALVVALLVGPYGWDDGAITLAFAKTFARTGTIALTARSEVVEGFSSITWFLLNSGVARVNSGFDAMIAASQMLTGLCFAFSALYMGLIARRLDIDPVVTQMLLWTYVLCGPVLQEIANGMEMALLTLAGLGLIYHLYFARNLALACLFAVVFLATRFEAMVYYAFILLPLLFERRFRPLLVLVAWGLGVVLAVGLARWQIFGELVPNTVLAKQQIPYRQLGMAAVTVRLAGATEILRVMPLLVLGFALLVFGGGRPLLAKLWADRSRLQVFLVLLMPVAGVTLFNFAIGANAGYKMRMHHLALPLFLLAGGVVIAMLFPRPSRRQLSYLATVLTASVALSYSMGPEKVFSDMALTLTGKRPSDAHYFGITPYSYRLSGNVADRVRIETGRTSIALMTPDIGGLGLCCENIRVVDLGLLANKTLARKGYAALGQQLEAERPEIIEAHEPWSRAAGIYALPGFQRAYVPALIENTRLYLRTDVARSLVSRSGAQVCPVTDPACLRRGLATHRYVTEQVPEDDVAYLGHGAFVVLD